MSSYLLALIVGELAYQEYNDAERGIRVRSQQRSNCTKYEFLTVPHVVSSRSQAAPDIRTGLRAESLQILRERLLQSQTAIEQDG